MQIAIGLLAVLGMIAIEGRKDREHGDLWRNYAEASSLVPFLAILQGRQRFVFGEIGWLRFGGVIAVYIALLGLHSVLIGVSPLPAP